MTTRPRKEPARRGRKGAPETAQRYTTIVFDLGNTLIRFDHGISARKIANLFRIDAGTVYELFADSLLARDFDRGAVSPRDFHRRATALIGCKLPYRDFTAIWNGIFWEDAASCAIVRQLKGAYRLFLLSNVNRLHFEHIRRTFDVIGLFDELIVSYVVGAMKPDRKIFDHVIERAGGEAREILYVDDRADLTEAARRYGIDAITYRDAAQLKDELERRGVSLVSADARQGAE